MHQWSIAKAVIKHTQVLLQNSLSRGFYMYSFMGCCSTKSSKVAAYPQTTWERALDKSSNVEISHQQSGSVHRMDVVHLIRRRGFDELNRAWLTPSILVVVEGR